MTGPTNYLYSDLTAYQVIKTIKGRLKALTKLFRMWGAQALKVYFKMTYRYMGEDSRG